MPRRPRCSAGALLGLGAGLILMAFGAAVRAAPATGTGDPLARPEFDREVSVDMKDAKMADVFRFFAGLTQVPFVLEFDREQSPTVTFKATNMVSRGILASLASSYGLVYSSTDEGIIVRRRDAPPSAERLTVGAWPSRPGPRYRLEVLVRDGTGQVVHRSSIAPQLGVVGELRLGLKGREVTVLDRKRSVAEPRYVDGIELAVCVRRDNGGALDLLMEMVTTQALSDARYVEDHAVALRTVGSGETLLFKTADGHEIVLTGWSRVVDGEPTKPVAGGERAPVGRRACQSRRVTGAR